MSSISLRAVALLTVVLVASGCGGNGSDQSNASGAPGTQDKHTSISVKQASSPYAIVVQQLYVAYFGRPADPAGLANFESALAAAQAPTDVGSLAAAYGTNKAVQSLIDSFGTSKESQALYGSGSTQDFVTAVFNNVLGRAPLASGLSYWSDAIDSGSLSKGDAALAIMAGAFANTTAQGKTDTQLINNRLAVASTFTTQLVAQGASNYYSGSGAASSGRQMLSQIDSTTDINAFAAEIGATITQLENQPGISFVAGNVTPPINLTEPAGLVHDSKGNLYITDSYSSVVFKLTPTGNFSVFAGVISANGLPIDVGASSVFSNPTGIAIDFADNLYIADSGNNAIYKITPAGVVITLAGMPRFSGFADGNGQSARFYSPQGLAVDSAGNVYVADFINNAVRKVTPEGVVTTVAGSNQFCGTDDGNVRSAKFCEPAALAVDSAGNIYVADQAYGLIRKIAPDGIVSTIAGGALGPSCEVDGVGRAASFCMPRSMAIDATGNLYVTDASFSGQVSSTIRKVTPSGVVTTIAGNPETTGFLNGTGTSSTFFYPTGIAFNQGGSLLVADAYNSSIREISPAGVVSTFAGTYGVTGSTDGTGSAASFTVPQGIVADANGNLYVADKINDTIRKITPAGVVTTFAGSVQAPFGPDSMNSVAYFYQPIGIAIDNDGTLYVADSGDGALRSVTTTGLVTALPNLSYSAYVLARDASGNIYVCNPDQVVRISSSGEASVIATFGGGGIALDSAGNAYVADTRNNVIRKISQGGTVVTVAGSSGVAGSNDGVGTAALFHAPKGLVLDGDGNLYIADSGNNTIRKMTPSGVVTTVAGSATVSATIFGGLPGGISQPQYLTFAGKKTLYVTTPAAVVRVQLP